MQTLQLEYSKIGFIEIEIRFMQISCFITLLSIEILNKGTDIEFYLFGEEDK